MRPPHEINSDRRKCEPFHDAIVALRKAGYRVWRHRALKGVHVVNGKRVPSSTIRMMAEALPVRIAP